MTIRSGVFEIEKDDYNKLVQTYEILPNDVHISFEDFCGKLVLIGVNKVSERALDLMKNK